MVFKKGDPPGPGRGKKNTEPNTKPKGKGIFTDHDLFDLLEDAVRRGLNSKDVNEQLVATRAGINLQKLKGPVKDESVVDPLVKGFVELIMTLTMTFKHLDSGEAVLNRMLECCPSCKLLGKPVKPAVEGVPFCTDSNGRKVCGLCGADMDHWRAFEMTKYLDEMEVY